MPTELTWLGHGSWSIKTGSHSILLDPFLDDNPSSPVKADDVEADYILVSHGHFDHVADVASIANRTQATVVAVFEIAQWFGQKHRVENTTGMNLGGGIDLPFGRVKMTPAWHSSQLPDGSYGGNPGGFLLTLADGRRLRVLDTRKDEQAGDIVHVLEAPVPADLPAGAVLAEIDWERRHRLMRVHTSLHLLCTLVDAPVTGGSVRDGSGRLDFDLPENTLDKEALRAELNRLVSEAHDVSYRWVTDDELDASPELVRTMSVAPPRGEGRVRLVEIAGVDLQACGGTHVANTAEIGALKVGKIEKKGRQNRRVTIAFEED